MASDDVELTDAEKWAVERADEIERAGGGIWAINGLTANELFDRGWDVRELRGEHEKHFRRCQISRR